MAKTLKNKYVYNNIVYPAGQEDQAKARRGPMLGTILDTPTPEPVADIHFRIETVRLPDVEIIKAIEDLLNKLADNAQEA